MLISMSSMGQKVSTEKPKDLDYYMMKNDNVVHFLVTGEVETVMNNATLLNGTVITSTGEVVKKDGSKLLLKNGECVNAAGEQDNCEKLDANVKDNASKKEKK